MNGMRVLFTDGEWQEVFVSENPKDDNLSIVFNLKIDDSIQFDLTVEQIKELCDSLMKHVEQFN